jgi:hypothetical protein
VLAIDEHGVILSGKITNNSDLALQDAILMYPGGSLVIGDLASGASYDVNLPLVKAQVVGQRSNGVSLPTLVYSPPPATYYSYSNDDTTLADIVGTSNYYDSQESYQRYLLLSAALDVYGQVTETAAST